MGREQSQPSPCSRSTVVCHRALEPQTSRPQPSEACDADPQSSRPQPSLLLARWALPGGLLGRRKFGLTLAAAIQAEMKDAALQDDRVARKQRYPQAG